MTAERQIERYRKGLGFSDLQMRRAIRGLGGFANGGPGVAAMIKRLPAKRKQFVLGQLKARASLHAGGAGLWGECGVEGYGHHLGSTVCV